MNGSLFHKFAISYHPCIFRFLSRFLDALNPSVAFLFLYVTYSMFSTGAMNEVSPALNISGETIETLVSTFVKLREVLMSTFFTCTLSCAVFESLSPLALRLCSYPVHWTCFSGILMVLPPRLSSAELLTSMQPPSLEPNHPRNLEYNTKLNSHTEIRPHSTCRAYSTVRYSA